MRAAASLVVMMALAFANPAAAGPDWRPGEVTQVSVLDASFVVQRVITDRARLDQLSGCLRRAPEVERRAGRGWTHRLDIRAARHGGRWLYDAASGELSALSKWRVAVFRLDATERAAVNALLAPRSEER